MESARNQKRRVACEGVTGSTSDGHELVSRIMNSWHGSSRARMVGLRAEVACGSTVQPRPHRESRVQPYLLSMYTEPDFRRRGVASMVVKEAIEWCRRNKHERLMLHASEMGRGVYSKLGFKRTWEMRLDLVHK